MILSRLTVELNEEGKLLEDIDIVNETHEQIFRRRGKWTSSEM